MPGGPGSVPGPLVSATRTSPFGSTYIQRGWSSPLANALTFKPAAAAGIVPAGHPAAFATLTLVISALSGGGSIGLGPMPASSGSRAGPPQAARAPQTKVMTGRLIADLQLARQPTARFLSCSKRLTGSNGSMSV